MNLHLIRVPVSRTPLDAYIYRALAYSANGLRSDELVTLKPAWTWGATLRCPWENEVGREMALTLSLRARCSSFGVIAHTINDMVDELLKSQWQVVTRKVIGGSFESRCHLR